MRGTLNGRNERRACAGIIPAHAGNTIKLCRVNWYDEDHPRACGEHTPLMLLLFPSRGSSPRMRGTLQAGACM